MDFSSSKSVGASVPVNPDQQCRRMPWIYFGTISSTLILLLYTIDERKQHGQGKDPCPLGDQAESSGHFEVGPAVLFGPSRALRCSDAGGMYEGKASYGSRDIMAVGKI